jgi:hypothetical protein
LERSALFNLETQSEKRFLSFEKKRRSLVFKSIRVGDPKYLQKKVSWKLSTHSSGVVGRAVSELFAFALLLYVRAMTEKRTMERRRKDDEENNE